MTMDRRTLIAIAICIVFLLFYQPLLRLVGLGAYLEPEAPPVATRVDSVAVDTSRTAASRAPGATTAIGDPARAIASAPPLRAATPAIERAIRIETPLYHAEFSSRGARLLSVELKRYATGLDPAGGAGPAPPRAADEDVSAGRRVSLHGGPSFALDLGSGENLQSLNALNYAVEESLDATGAVRALAFTARDSSGMTVRQTWRVRPRDYALDLEVEIAGVPDAWRVSDYSLTLRSWPLVTEADVPTDHRMLRSVRYLGNQLKRDGVGKFLKRPERFEGNASFAGVQTRYFLGAVAIGQGSARGVYSSAERRPLPADALARLPKGARGDEEVAQNALVVGLPGAAQPTHQFLVYFGPAEYRRLESLGHELQSVVDFGWNWILPFSRALLWLLDQLHDVVRNWGAAILLLSVVVRLLLYPLNQASMKSMRGLQKIQPEVERIRQKYKNDPQAMNAAMMAIYKEHKVNPAGGCLPLLLQMPLFLALYQVLLNAIELRQAPFVAWVHDLSAPDHLFSVAGFPIRLLPLLMAGSGFLQQKLTPSDPRQAPTMYMMNVIMLVFFYNLPSGLVLYWTVMNLLNALQQWWVLRSDSGPSAAVVVEAAEPKPARKKGRRT
jgi:YidC/Oxa1 family membrane protein insertase